jgi:hypothetical protein
MPDKEQVRLIFKDTYNYYLRWKDISNPDDWVILMQEMKEIDHRYDCDLCRQILLELVKVIEFKSKEGFK